MSTWRLTLELSSSVLPASGTPNPTNPNGPSDPSDQSALAKGTTGNKPKTRPPATTSVQSPILADLARLNMLDLLFTSSPGSGKVNENRAQLLASAFQRYDIDGSGELDERELSLAFLDQATMLLNFHNKVRACLGARSVRRDLTAKCTLPFPFRLTLT